MSKYAITGQGHGLTICQAQQTQQAIQLYRTTGSVPLHLGGANTIRGGVVLHILLLALAGLASALAPLALCGLALALAHSAVAAAFRLLALLTAAANAVVRAIFGGGLLADDRQLLREELSVHAGTVEQCVQLFEPLLAQHSLVESEGIETKTQESQGVALWRR
jgi:hypothetical protein